MKMKLTITALMCLLLLAPMAAMPNVSAVIGTTTAVLVDFGDGQSHWVDINVNATMTAYDTTLQAAAQLGIEVNASYWSGYGWSVNWMGDSKTAYNGTSGEFWGFFIWNSTNAAWQMASVGASSVIANSVSAIAWGYFPWGTTPLSTPDHRSPWMSFRHDNSNSGLQKMAAPNNITLKWSENLGNGGIYAPIVAANGLAYAITGGIYNLTSSRYDTNSVIYCLNSTGGVVWSREIGVGWYQTASPLIYDGKVIVPSANGKVYAFSAMTGADAWAQPFDMESGSVYGAPSPIAYGGSIYITSGTGKLFALSGFGTQLWNATVASAIYSSSPAAKDGVIYIGAEDGKLRAFNSMNGANQWNASIGSKIRSMPMLTASGIVVSYVNNTGNSPTSGGVAVVSYSGHIMSYAQTGVTPSSPALTRTGIVSATTTKLFMTSASGQALWNVSLGSSSGISSGAPSAVNGSIFMVVNEAHSRLIAVSEKGQIYWQTFLEPAQYSLAAPTVADGILYTGGDDGWMHTFNLNVVAPSASANFSVARHNLEATFSTTAGTGSLFEYNWAFGDGSHGTGMSMVHTYAAAGMYNATLTISNLAGQQKTVTNKVTVHAFTAPRDFAATTGEGKVTLSWLAPADDGGSDIIGYEIYRAVQGGSPSILANVPGSNLTYVDATGVVGTNYSYYVVPVNMQGAGPLSASVIATPQAIPAPVDNTMLYVGVIIVALVVVAAIAIVMSGRKK
jgi:outer membrane protein assembly factor BamB